MHCTFLHLRGSTLAHCINLQCSLHLSFLLTHLLSICILILVLLMRGHPWHLPAAALILAYLTICYLVLISCS